MIEDQDKLLAYDDVTAVVRELLGKHPSAKVYVTGHSLGGALAVLYSGMLYYNDEKSIVEKLAAVYTFGQPRVGDEKFAAYMRQKLVDSAYFRVVYCNDLVPRVPFDDDLFAFKHFGLCFYYNSRYKARVRLLLLPSLPAQDSYLVILILKENKRKASSLINSRLNGEMIISDFLELKKETF